MGNSRGGASISRRKLYSGVGAVCRCCRRMSAVWVGGSSQLPSSRVAIRACRWTGAVAMLPMCTRLGLAPLSAVHAKMIFLRRLELYHAPEDLVAKLRTIEPQPIRRAGCTVVGSRTLWIVLGFHPALHERGLSRVVARLSCDPGLRALWRCAWGSEMPRLRLAWRNDLSNVARRALGLVHQLREFEV